MGAAISLALSVSACSSSAKLDGNRKPVHSVLGKVLVQGKPAVGAYVFFVPVGEPANPTDPRPRAEVKDDGSFVVSMYGSGDGAPVGEYVVTVLWEGEGGYDRLKGQYNDPAKSKLRVVVKEGPNELAPFQLN